MRDTTPCDGYPRRGVSTGFFATRATFGTITLTNAGDEQSLAAKLDNTGDSSGPSPPQREKLISATLRVAAGADGHAYTATWGRHLGHHHWATALGSLIAKLDGAGTTLGQVHCQRPRDAGDCFARAVATRDRPQFSRCLVAQKLWCRSAKRERAPIHAWPRGRCWATNGTGSFGFVNNLVVDVTGSVYVAGDVSSNATSRCHVS